MLKYYSLIIGENPEYTKHFHPSSKRKIALYANCLMIPVILWTINSFLLVNHVLEGGMLASIFTALLAGFIIFLIERAIIMSSESKMIFVFRITLGIVIAFLGSISIDEVIFKNDIDNQIALYKQTEILYASGQVEKELDTKITIQQGIVSQKEIKWTEALNDAKGEADGTSGSGEKRVGEIALLKLDVASIWEIEYNKESSKLSAMITNLEAEKEIAKANAEASFNGNALLLRIRAMFDLISKDKFMLGVYILFTLFLFCLEFLVVLVKIGNKNSIDEDLEIARVTLLRSKTKKILERSEMFFKPESLTSSVREANRAIQGNPSAIFE